MPMNAAWTPRRQSRLCGQQRDGFARTGRCAVLRASARISRRAVPLMVPSVGVSVPVPVPPVAADRVPPLARASLRNSPSSHASAVIISWSWFPRTGAIRSLVIHSSAACACGPRSTRSPTLNSRSRAGSNASVSSACSRVAKWPWMPPPTRSRPPWRSARSVRLRCRARSDCSCLGIPSWRHSRCPFHAQRSLLGELGACTGPLGLPRSPAEEAAVHGARDAARRATRRA